MLVRSQAVARFVRGSWLLVPALGLVLAAAAGCEQAPAAGGAAATGAAAPKVAAKAAPPPEYHVPADPKNIVSIAAGSKDHTTLVAALKAVDYAESIANPGPFTVFAPTNEAFDKLPKGTVEGLLVPAKADDLRNILKYHVAVSTYAVGALHDGETLGMANGGKVTIHVKGGKVTINDANIIASIPASNGIVHVIDAVLLPPAPK